ncbi:ABC transporter substrate-binding protein [Tropicimonas aquimaris]|uniref:ABC transporter substrate-binding protein n=1 Tax=Tropicimonas aquimaris TaxID=914152 RepID=A0ABW3IRB8_9RHOB
MPRMILIASMFASLLALAGGLHAETPVLRIAVLEAGTVNWEIDTIDHYGLDAAQGFDMEVQGMAGGSASQVAFQGGEADVIVSDWIWVARQRAEGRDYVFVPYSKAVGGVMVAADSPARSLEDLKGGKIGIAGGPLDKSWIILRAYAEKYHGMDLAGETEQVFGAPPLIYKSALSGELVGAINYWHFMARMRAAGMRDLISVAEAAEALGLDPDLPLLGYVFRGETLRDQPDLVAGFAAASRAAKELLSSDESAWERLRPRMPAANDAEFEALKAGYRAGIPDGRDVDPDSAARVFELMGELGGSDLIGSSSSMPEGVFVDVGG